MLPDYHIVFRKYNEQLKPLISEIEGRLERFSQPLLLNLAGVFDYMSIAAAEGQDSKERMEEANGLVDLCIAQSYMSLIYAITKTALMRLGRCLTTCPDVIGQKRLKLKVRKRKRYAMRSFPRQKGICDA